MSARFSRRPEIQPTKVESSSPLRAVDPPSSPAVEAAEPGSHFSVLEHADQLGIPWERILADEIRAEEALRRYLAQVDGDWALAAALPILPFSFLRSWRVRNRIESLSAEARAAHARDAQRELRRAFEHLRGRNDADRTTLAEHLWFGYQRVLLLQRVSRAAAASRGEPAERLAFICVRARCAYDDAAWALGLEEAPRPGHRLDAAVRKVRDEGFQIPRAETEAKAFASLRRMVRASPHLSRRRARPSPTRPESMPRRLPLPVESL